MEEEKKKKAHHCECGCEEGGECHCEGHCHCDDEKCHCHCEEHCECDECCECEHEHDGCDCAEEGLKYLAMAQRLQADFDNYRKHVAQQLDYQREEGKKSVIEAFLPCLDTFKEAKKSITDEGVLAGINMIEEKILNTLKNLKVEKIPSIGNVYDHNLHEVIAVMRDESKESDVILEEFQAGYTLNGKVIRYSKVVVNKL